MTKLEHKLIMLEDGHRVGVSHSDGGRVLVFIHGFAVNRRVYDPMLEILAGEGFEVISMDLSGHGDTDPLPAGHSFDDMVDLVVRTLEYFAVRRAVIVGHSLGGRIAAQIGAQTDLAQSLVLMGDAMGQPFDDYENQPLFLKLVSIPFRVGAALIDTVADGPKNPLDALLYLSMMSQAVASSYPGLLRVAMAVSFGVDTIVPLDELWHRMVPTTMIHGERDLIVPLVCAESAADIAGAELRILKGVYHSWMISNPERGALEILRALE